MAYPYDDSRPFGRLGSLARRSPLGPRELDYGAGGASGSPGGGLRLGIGPVDGGPSSAGVSAIDAGSFQFADRRGVLSRPVLRQVPDQGMGGAIGPAGPPMVGRTLEGRLERPLMRQVPNQGMGGSIGSAEGPVQEFTKEWRFDRPLMRQAPGQGMGGWIGPAEGPVQEFTKEWRFDRPLMRQAPGQGMGGWIGPDMEHPVLRQVRTEHMGGAISAPMERPMMRQTPDQGMGGSIGPAEGPMQGRTLEMPVDRPLMRQTPNQGMGGAIGPAALDQRELARPPEARYDGRNPHQDLMQRYPWTRWAARSRRPGRADLSRFMPRGLWR